MSTSSSSSSTSGGLSELMSGLTRLTGTNLYSGLDTDKIVKALVSTTQSKIDKQGQLEQKAEWRREMLRSVITDMQSFSKTYFSYSSSNSNILSSTFFNSTSITSSSNIVSATGNANTAKNIVINSISQQASQANTVSSQVSNQSFSSTDIYNEWTNSNVGGQSVVVNYGGKDYTLTIDSSVLLNSENSTTGTDGKGNATKTVNDSEIQKIVDGLNNQISSNSAIKGKLSFSYDTGTGKISLAATDTSQSITLNYYQNTSNKNDNTGRKFLSALGFVSTSSGVGTVTADNAIDKDVYTSGLFNQTISSGSYVTLDYNGENYTVKLGESIDITGADKTTIANEIQTALSKQIASTDGIKGKVSVNVDASGKISFSSGSGTLSVAGGSQNLLKGLGLENADGSYLTSGTGINVGNLNESYLGDTLAGSTLTFTLDGVKKSITMDASDESQYSSADGIAKYLGDKLSAAFGSEKITVSTTDTNGNGNKELKFQTADPSSVLSIASSDGVNITGDYGALRVAYGESNRPEMDKTLKELASGGEFRQALTANSEGNYVFNINGKNFTFSQDTTLSNVLTTINNDNDAGIQIMYSQTADKFSITAKDSGSNGTIAIQDVGGNLASVLTGSTYSTAANARKTIDSSTITGGSVTLSKDTTYSFALDGLNTSQKVTISAGTYTLDQLQNQIQTSLDASGSPVSGKITVGTDSVNNQLTFSTNDSSALNIAYTGGTDFLGMGSGKTNLQSTSDIAALNGSGSLYNTGKNLKMNISLDGGNTFSDIERSSNSFTLDNVTLSVSGTTKTGDSKITFASSTSTDDLYKKISDFVDAYNKIVKEVNTYTTDTPEKTEDHKDKYAPLTDSQKEDMTSDEIDKWNTKAKKGLLQNDSDLNNILSDMREAMTSTVKSVGMSLSDIGISTKSMDYTSGGELEINETTLKKELATEPDKIQQMFTNATDGVSTTLKKVLDKNVGTFGGNGILILRAGTDTTVNDTSELSTQIKSYETNISKLKTQMQTEETRWWNKFTAMEQSLSMLNSQYSSLTSSLSSSS